jgi:acyl-CoA thioester hydrolase
MPHNIEFKVYYEDTDAGGVVYHANYLRFMERARTELLVEMDHDPARYHREGLFFVVTAVNIKYKRPAKLGDTITIETELGYMKKASMMLLQKCMRGDELLVEAEVTVAFINEAGRPQRFPKTLLDDVEKKIRTEQ